MSVNEAIERQLQLLEWNRAIQSASGNTWTKQLNLVHIDAAVSRSLEYGNTYFWSNDFCKLLEGQSNMLPEDAVINLTDFLSEAGFIWFERPIKMPHNQELINSRFEEWANGWASKTSEGLKEQTETIRTDTHQIQIDMENFRDSKGLPSTEIIKEFLASGRIGKLHVKDTKTGKEYEIADAELTDIRQALSKTQSNLDGMGDDLREWESQLQYQTSQLEPRPLCAISWVLTTHGAENIAMFIFWMEDKVLSPQIGMIPGMIYPWQLNKNLQGVLDFSLATLEDTTSDDDPDRLAQAMKYACASILFMNQKVFHHSDERPSRAVRHRISKWRPEPIVKVIQLRRHQQHTNTNADHEPVEHDFQWMVTGHWRNQWYPSTGTHQTIWIAPYIKGPDDKPLKEPRGRVYAVVR